MKVFKKLLIVLVVFSSAVFAQEKEKVKEIPVFHEVSNKDVVLSIYPDAIKVEKVNNYWFKILDKDNVIIGFAMSSMNFCKTAKGYHDLTPVMIITDKTWVIQKVAILSNWESPGYIRRLDRKGFFKIWAGKTLTDAKSVQLDGYSGATCTAKAVAINVNFLLDKGMKVLPKNK
jgi:hypothetical protein